MIVSDLLADLGIPADYGLSPAMPFYPEASELEEVEPNIVGRMQKLTPDTARAWRRMKDEARNDGVELYIVSGFRSITYQVELFRKKLAAGQHITEILKVNAAPGFSQHHTGRAVDIATPGTRPLTEEFAASAAFEWLARNAARFEFQMPYGPDNAYGISYEPWHWSRLDAQAQ